MATIKSAIALYDGVTGPLQSMHKAMNIVISSFETMQDTSGNAVNVTAIQQAREELGKAGAAFDEIENEIRQADQAQQQFNRHLGDASPAADALGNKLKGILATVASIATIKTVLDWVFENLALADTQRNAENQLRAVLANMGVEDIEVPVVTNTAQAADGLNAYAEALENVNGVQAETAVALDDAAALDALGAYQERLQDVDSARVTNTAAFDSMAAVNAVDGYKANLDAVDGITAETRATFTAADGVQEYADSLNALNRLDVKNTLALDDAQALGAAADFSKWAATMNGSKVETALTLNDAEALARGAAFERWKANMDGTTIRVNATTDTTQAVDAVRAFSGAVAGLDGSTLETTLTADTGAAVAAVVDYGAILNTLAGATVRTSAAFDTADAMNAGISYSAMVDALAGADAKTTASFDAVNALRDAAAYSSIISDIEQTEISNTLNLNVQDAANNYENMISEVQGRTLENTLVLNTETTSGLRALDAYASAAAVTDGKQLDNVLVVNMAPAMQALTRYKKAAAAADGNEIGNTLTLDTTQAEEAHEQLVAAVDGVELENALTLDTAQAAEAMTAAVADLTATPIMVEVQVDATQTISAFDAIKDKAAEIQSRGIYGDEAMIAGAAEFATYFSDAEAIMSMMDTLANYAMGMSGFEELDAKAMTDYATNLGKIMTGAYDAMSKKGFEISDAQKAIIEGTATQAQIVDTLGAEYLDMSEDMRAAAAIDAIITESWGNLYDTMSNTPQGKIIQLKNSFGDLREELGNKLYGAVGNVAGAFESRWGTIESLMYALTNAASALVSALGLIASFALDVAGFFTDNWSWIEPIIWGIVGAFLAYNGVLLAYNAIKTISAGVEAIHAARIAMTTVAEGAETAATFAATAAQYGFNAALLACPVFWVVAGILAIIAVIVAVMRAFDLWGAKTHSVVGTIVGIFTVAGAFIGNLFFTLINAIIDIFVVLWNFIASFANFFGSVFDDPVGAITRLFFDLADTVLSILESLASAIDTIFGSNLSGAVADWRDSLGGWVESTFGKGAEVMAKMDASDLHLDRIEYKDAFELGAKFGDGISDKLGGIFNPPGIDAFEFDTGLNGLGGDAHDTAANTAKMADKVDFAEEDLKYLRDIAEREAINRITTAEITVQQENTNYIDRDTDVDGIMDAWAADFAEKLDISAEGVHE